MATEYVISIKVQGEDRASGPLGAVGGALGRIAELVTAAMTAEANPVDAEGKASSSG